MYVPSSRRIGNDQPTRPGSLSTAALLIESVSARTRGDDEHEQDDDANPDDA
jgi:hypothetical protein